MSIGELRSALPVLESHPVAHLAVASDGSILWASSLARAVLALTDNLPLRWDQLPFDTRTEPSGDVILSARNAAARDSEFRVIRADALLDGRPVVLLVLEDLGDRPRLMEELRHSDASFRDVAENLPEALFRYLLRPNGTDSVLYMSPRCFDLWEVKAEVVMLDASPLWQVVDPDDLPAMKASVMRSAQELSPWYHEWRIITPSGVRKWLQGSGRPQRLEDGGTLWNTFILDVSSRKQAEHAERQLRAELRRAQQLESLGRLAGGVAHDFNNLLTVIIGYTQSALDVIPPHSDQAEQLHLVLEAGRRSADLTRQLLAFARRQPGEPAVVNVSRSVEDLTTILSKLLGKSAQLISRLSAAAPPVTIDPTQLDQVISNLVLNARDAMPDGGLIRLSVEPNEHDGVPGARLTVEDTGTGMDEATLARIMEPFFTTKSAGRGTGLGLSTVYGIVQQAGGHLSVTSEVGVGSRFEVWLPAATVSATEAAGDGGQPPAAKPPVLGGRVLVVEDDPLVREFVAHAVRRMGFESETVNSFTEAQKRLSAADTPPLQLVISDVRLADGSGPALGELLRRTRPNVHLVLMTGYVFDEGIISLPEANQFTMLAKPFTVAQLRAVIESRLGAESAGWPKLT